MHSLLEAVRMSAYMFWETLWALVLGFGLSGAVQAFVSRDRMQRTLGTRGPAAIARASGLGMVSSSCSYAATAMARSLFQKGADFVTAMVFMFASTNLVIELGIVLIVLIGWQFAAAEFVGGAIMIVLLALLGGTLLRSPPRAPQDESHDAHTHKATWSDAASYAIADLTMLRRELVIGYGVAGLIAVYIPTHIWHAIFFEGHGLATTVENAVVGPFIAVVSFVCSIGNVPLAAALWRGGLAFGGVIAFIFADLITFPLLLIYRKYYGTKLTLQLLGVFWLVMSAAGLAVDLIFSGAGLVPHRAVAKIAEAHFAWNYTTFLNIAALIVFGVLYRLSRKRGSSDAYAIDPVCGMQVRTADAPASIIRDGERIYFCSDHCRERLERNAAH
jgi:uncharacterized membrane protein YraQ (UPF0718 family)/YHS domain-containing protein